MRRRTALTIFVLAALAGVAGAADPALVAWWQFDEGFGEVAQDAVGGNDGMIHGATWTGGRIGGALSFDGADDYVWVADSDALDITGDITIAAWVWLDTGGEHDIISKCWGRGAYDNPYDFYTNIAYEPHLSFVRADAAGHEYVYSDKELLLNEWHHLAVTVENKSPSFYVDGVLTAKWGMTTFTKTPTGNDAPLLIGARESQMPPMDGMMDDVRLYNRALSAEEIRELSIPEPASLVMMGTGFVLARLRTRRR